MQKVPTRFPKRAAWRAVDRILRNALDMQPVNPDDYPDGAITLKQYRWIEGRYYDFEHIIDAAEALRSAIGALR